VEDPEPENEIEPSGPLMFHGVMVAEETETDADDGMVRVFQKNALTWREPPLTLTYEHIEQGMRTEVLGHLDRIWRLPDDPRRIAYEGSFDDSGDENVDIRIGQIANGTLGRVSIH